MNDKQQRDHPDLDALRAELAQIDRRILELAARRRDLALMIGASKEASGSPTRDFTQERAVFERAHRVADEFGLPHRLSDALMHLLIGHSLTMQEKQRIRRSEAGTGQSALVIGGSGRMGRWFVDFLSTQGFRVEVADPAGPVENFGWHENWEDTGLAHDFILVAAPLRPSAEILRRIAIHKPRGIVFDVGSLKAPLAAPLKSLHESGVRVTSLHPMFGPNTEMLSGKHVILVDVGDRGATEAVRNLFSSTMASVAEMTLEDHDRLIALVLGLSHALNIAFFSALARSGEPVERLADLSSTTFDEQLRVAARVAGENPHLYFEIQHLNKAGAQMLSRLREVVTDLETIVASGNEDAFTEMMLGGRAYLNRPSP